MVSPTLENCLRKLGTINIKWKYVLFCCTYSTVQISIHTVQCTVYNNLITLPNWSIPYIQSTYTASLTQWPWLCLSEVLKSTYLHCLLEPMAMTLPNWSTYSLHTYTASLNQWPWLCLTEVLTVYILTLPAWPNSHNSALLKYLQSTYLYNIHCLLDPITMTLPYWTAWRSLLYLYTDIYTVLWSQALFWVGSGVFKVLGPTSASVSQLHAVYNSTKFKFLFTVS